MELTPEQQGILDGEKGATQAKVMETLVMYGKTFGAEKMVPVTSEYGHYVTSFGLSMMGAVYQLMDELAQGEALSLQPFSVDPYPVDRNVPSTFLQRLVFRYMYSKQNQYDRQLKEFGLMSDDAYTCTCYMEEVGNIPEKGDVLSWAESSAVVYANSVLGARCNRNSGLIEMFGSIVGYVPYFGLLTDQGRQADWTVDIQTDTLPEPQLLGSAIGMKVMEDVPYIRGLDRWFDDLSDNAKDYLKDMGAATASNGAVGLFHVENLTPEAREQGADLVPENTPTYVITQEILDDVKAGYPVMWKNHQATPKLCFVGCPHLSRNQLHRWTENLSSALEKAGRTRVAVDTVMTAAPAVGKAFKETEDYQRLTDMGVVVSYICPLMYMNNPLCAKMPVITNSNKLRTYTTARYQTDAEILHILTGGEPQ